MSAIRDFSFPATGGAGGNVPSYSSAQREMVREQLERILASPLFRNSKRFPDFLRYTVNHALDGETEGMKERTLGVSVFGRDPNYDTSVDPVVRVTAAEVRKRITQYYQTVGHERELRVEFERGSYIPEFRFPDEIAKDEQPTVAAVSKEAKPKRNTKHWVLVACLATPYLALSIFLLGSTRQTALDRFWSPIVSSKNAALLCIPGTDAPFAQGQSRPMSDPASAAGSSGQLPPAVAGIVSLGDSEALSLVSEVLGSKSKEFHIRPTGNVNLDDLKEGPVVLIGAFNNPWTMRLTSGLRYTFVRDNGMHYIADAEIPSGRQWAVVDDSASQGGDSADYGLISRVIDLTTGRALVTVGGVQHFGTEAAAECLTDSSCLDAASKLAPGDWKKTNLQIVLKTTVIGGNSGQPQVLAAYVW
jgi:hypothetical protein